jgi:1,2-diacylglycerol 3-alpha-glucosyltransferase
MRIGVFTDSYRPEISGVVSSICTLKQALEERGHTVFIFAPDNEGVPAEDRVFRLPSMPAFFEKSLRVVIGVTPRALDAIALCELDLIHTQTEFSVGVLGKIVARAKGLPVVHTYHTMYKDYVHYFDPRGRRGRNAGKKDLIRLLSEDMVRVLSRDFCNSSAAVIAPTEKVRELLLEYGVTSPIEILPSGVALGRFREAAADPGARTRARAELGIPEGTPLVVSIGRVAKEKSLDMALRAMPGLVARVPGARLLVIGDGPERAELEALASRTCPPGSVLFAGSRPWAEIPAFYRAGDAFLTASTTETQGLTVLEAMAAEVPVVARRDPSFESMIRDGEDGLLFSDEEELVGALQRVLSDRGLATALAAAARDKARGYSAEAFGEGLEAIYGEAIRRRQAARVRARRLPKKEPRAYSAWALFWRRGFFRLLPWLR